ncbi:PilZ domain-containing protein [Thermodesulfobacteriota bacterium]
MKEISLNGAFVTCPRPFPIGEAFQIKIFLGAEKSLTLKADVLWNNSNVPQDQIVARGMKVRFLQLSDDERQILNEIVSDTLLSSKKL